MNFPDCLPRVFERAQNSNGFVALAAHRGLRIPSPSVPFVTRTSTLSKIKSPQCLVSVLRSSTSKSALADQDQLPRLKDPKYEDHAAAIVRHHIANGSTSLSDFSRRLPTGLPIAPPTTVLYCFTTGGTLVNGVQTGGRLTCTSFTISAPIPPAALGSEVMLTGKWLSIQTSVVRDPSGGTNHFRVGFGGGGLLETTGFVVKNGTICTPMLGVFTNTRLRSHHKILKETITTLQGYR
jgi:hypothetical protein